MIARALLVLLAFAATAHAQVPRPNIIFILTDDLAWNLVPHMPHVQAMQKQGVTFANYFVTDSLCCPSRASIFTGRYPHNTGIYRNTGRDGGYQAFRALGNDQSTFATALAAVGYRTGFLGKYLNGYQPRHNDPIPPGWTAWFTAGNAYKEFDYDLSENGRLVHYGHADADYLVDVQSKLATQFIKDSAGKPFLIEIATFAPHAPYIPAPRDANAFPGLQAPRSPAFGAMPDPSMPRWIQTHPGLPAAEIADIDRDFRKRAQSVQAVDTMIGALQAAVAAAGQAQNTYVVFSSDNGYHMGEHSLRPGKMTAFDTDIHVPLIITGPGIPAGHVVTAITENIDLNPTFVELAGGTPAANVDGSSLVPFLRGQSPAGWRTLTLVEHRGPHADPEDPDAPARHSGNPPTYEAIRSTTLSYVEYATGEREYHDLASDPYEMRNTFAALPELQKGRLHATVAAMQSCRDAPSCRAAQRDLAAQPLAEQPTLQRRRRQPPRP